MLCESGLRTLPRAGVCPSARLKPTNRERRIISCPYLEMPKRAGNEMIGCCRTDPVKAGLEGDEEFRRSSKCVDPGICYVGARLRRKRARHKVNILGSFFLNFRRLWRTQILTYINDKGHFESVSVRKIPEKRCYTFEK